MDYKAKSASCSIQNIDLKEMFYSKVGKGSLCKDRLSEHTHTAEITARIQGQVGFRPKHVKWNKD